MEHDFWHAKWNLNQIGFHLDYAHPVLERNLGLFKTDNAKRVFVPLCGKTLDIGYLMGQGYEVVAVELSDVAVDSVFKQLNLTPDISPWQHGKIYSSKNLTIFVGDFFTLTQQDLGELTFVYDRAAIVALPETMRIKYAQHLTQITQYAPQLLLTLDYDQSIAGGPPFAVSPQEVAYRYGNDYDIQLLEEADIIEGEPRFKDKGLTSFYQRAYKLIKSD